MTLVDAHTIGQSFDCSWPGCPKEADGGSSFCRHHAPMNMASQEVAIAARASAWTPHTIAAAGLQGPGRGHRSGHRSGSPKAALSPPPAARPAKGQPPAPKPAAPAPKPAAVAKKPPAQVVTASQANGQTSLVQLAQTVQEADANAAKANESLYAAIAALCAALDEIA